MATVNATIVPNKIDSSSVRVDRETRVLQLLSSTLITTAGDTNTYSFDLGTGSHDITLYVRSASIATGAGNLKLRKQVTAAGDMRDMHLLEISSVTPATSHSVATGTNASILKAGFAAGDSVKSFPSDGKFDLFIDVGAATAGTVEVNMSLSTY